MANRDLSPQQKRFVQLVVRGEPAARAYEKAGYKSKGNASAASASKLLTIPNVIEYKAELMKKVEDDSIMGIKDRMRYLTRVVKTPVGEIDENSDLCVEHVVTDNGFKMKKPDPLRAIDLMNKTDGSYAPEKHEVSLGDKFFETIASKKGLHNDCE